MERLTPNCLMGKKGWKIKRPKLKQKIKVLKTMGITVLSLKCSKLSEVFLIAWIKWNVPSTTKPRAILKVIMVAIFKLKPNILIRARPRKAGKIFTRLKIRSTLKLRR